MRSVQALMASILDYAGLYPPASLSSPEVVERYTRHLACDASWMLARLVWPVNRLGELATLARGRAPSVEPPSTEGAWAITAVAAEAGGAAFEADLAAIADFNARHAEPGQPAMRIDALECKAPDAAAIERALTRVPEDIYPYFEIPWAGDPRGTIAALSDASAGAKVRTGGVTKEAFPTPEALARFMDACRGARVPFKATAGLHRCVRHFEEATDAHHFGFLNVFVGACLLDAGRIDRDALEQVLAEESVERFEFREGSLGWCEERVNVSEIELARTRFAHSFGSCSFGEPLEDLVQLELVRAHA